MNRISLKLLTVCGITCFMACTTTQKPKTEKWSERMARSEMKRFPEPWMIEKGQQTALGIYTWTCSKIHARRMEAYRETALTTIMPKSMRTV